MNDEPMSGGGFVVPSFFASEEFLRSLLGMGPDLRSPEERDADRAAQLIEAAAARAEIVRAHAEVMAGATGLRLAVLAMHGPHLGESDFGRWPRCHGCDWGGYEGEDPDFPCRTYELARDYPDA